MSEVASATLACFDIGQPAAFYSSVMTLPALTGHPDTFLAGSFSSFCSSPVHHDLSQ